MNANQKEPEPNDWPLSNECLNALSNRCIEPATKTPQISQIVADQNHKAAHKS